MGSLAGHAVPGTFFGVFAIWWTTQIARRRLARPEEKTAFVGTAAAVQLAIGGHRWRLPVEGPLKMLLSVAAMCCELYASVDGGRVSRLASYADLQHFTMYSFFLLSGFVDCLLAHRAASGLLPPGADHAALGLAYLAEWVLLFRRHGDGRVDARVHALLLGVVAACVLATALEASVGGELAPFVRAYFTLLQGTWFVQVGIVLYPPSGYAARSDDDGPDPAAAAAMFVWHAIGGFVLLVAVYLAALCSFRKRCGVLDLLPESGLTIRGQSPRRTRRKKRGQALYTSLPTEDEQTTGL